MKPKNMIIAFDNEQQLDRILAWAYSKGFDWAVPNYKEKARNETLNSAKNSFSRQESHAIQVDERSTLYQSPLHYYKSAQDRRNYRNYEFMNANNLPGSLLDCTIPEET